MESKQILKADLYMLVAACIWGCAFVAQRVSMSYIGPFTFNGLRFLLGAAVVWAFWRRRAGARLTGYPYAGGILLGTLLFMGATLQQIGMIWTTAGKGGFLTALYVVIVPVLGIARGQATEKSGWLGASLTLAGVYFLSVNQDLSLAPGDGYVIAGAIFWACHVQAVGELSKKHDPIPLAIVQFLVCAALSIAVAVLIEPFSLESLRGAAPSILYGGVMSVGVAYTLQVVAQRIAPPTHAAILLSLETVFAALAGWLILEELLSERAMLGCALILCGILLSHLGAARAADRR